MRVRIHIPLFSTDGKMADSRIGTSSDIHVNFVYQWEKFNAQKSSSSVRNSQEPFHVFGLSFLRDAREHVIG
eukprot:g22183.t1